MSRKLYFQVRVISFKNAVGKQAQSRKQARDSINSEVEFDGDKYTLIDTAGIRKKAKVE